MSRTNPRGPHEWGPEHESPRAAVYPDSVTVEETDPTIRKLYGPKGEVLRTYSNRPPIGFTGGAA